MIWEKTEISLGSISVGKRKTLEFKAIGDFKEILFLSSSCGCSTPEYDKETNILTVSYNPGPIPKHLKVQGWYSSKKTITVAYEDGTKDVLSFTAKIYKKTL